MNPYEKHMARFGGPHYQVPITIESLQEENEALREENEALQLDILAAQTHNVIVELKDIHDRAVQSNGNAGTIYPPNDGTRTNNNPSPGGIQ